jgi:hypothetical protein
MGVKLGSPVLRKKHSLGMPEKRVLQNIPEFNRNEVKEG